MDVLVRPAVVADARAIAIVAVDTWRAAYADLMPRALLASLDVDAREAGFRDALTPPLGARATYVGVADGGVVGFASFGPCRDADAPPRAGEIYALYVLPGRWGTGLGTALLSAALAEMEARELAPVSLWVLSGNARARRFYEREGFACVPKHERVRKPVRGYELAHARYVLTGA